VVNWRKENPLGSKKQCIRDTGISKNTVKSHWDKIGGGSGNSAPYSNVPYIETEIVDPPRECCDKTKRYPFTKVNDVLTKYPFMQIGDNCLLPNDFYLEKKDDVIDNTQMIKARKTKKLEKEARDAMLGTEKKKKIKKSTKKDVKHIVNNQQSIQFNSYGKQNRKRV